MKDQPLGFVTKVEVCSTYSHVLPFPDSDPPPIVLVRDDTSVGVVQYGQLGSRQERRAFEGAVACAARDLAAGATGRTRSCLTEMAVP